MKNCVLSIICAIILLLCAACSNNEIPSICNESTFVLSNDISKSTDLEEIDLPVNNPTENNESSELTQTFDSSIDFNGNDNYSISDEETEIIISEIPQPDEPNTETNESQPDVPVEIPKEPENNPAEKANEPEPVLPQEPPVLQEPITLEPSEPINPIESVEPIINTINIDYWLEYIKEYGQGIGLIYDIETTGSWDNPLVATTTNGTILERDIKNRLDRYKNKANIIYFNVWAEERPDGKFNIYIGYA